MPAGPGRAPGPVAGAVRCVAERFVPDRPRLP